MKRMVQLLAAFALGAALTTAFSAGATPEECDWSESSVSESFASQGGGFPSPEEALAHAEFMSPDIDFGPAVAGLGTGASDRVAEGDDRVAEVSTDEEGNVVYSVYLDDIQRGIAEVTRYEDGTYRVERMSVCWGV